jgi:hypothetical protein
LRAWFSSLGDATQRVVKVVIAAGAVATSIGAIVALWPDPDPPPAILDAEFSEITVDENIALSQFTARDEELDGAAASAELAAITLPLQPTVTQTFTTKTDTTETTETTESDTTQTDTTPTTVEADPGPSVEARRRVNQALGEALKNPDVGQIDIGATCQARPEDDDCALKALAFKSSDQGPAELKELLVKFFKEVRKRTLPTGVRQPLGVTVNYKLTMTGFRGEAVRVRWELHRQGGDGLPHDWLRKQRPATWEAEADQDSVSPNVWVPLPPEGGQLFVRLIAEDEDGVPVARSNTPRFQ